MMKRSNTPTTRERERYRKTSPRDNGKIWVFNIRSIGAKRVRKGGDKFIRSERGKDGNVFNGVYQGNIKEKSKDRLSNKL
jgi:hypothetical protein